MRVQAIALALLFSAAAYAQVSDPPQGIVVDANGVVMGPFTAKDRGGSVLLRIDGQVVDLDLQIERSKSADFVDPTAMSPKAEATQRLYFTADRCEGTAYIDRFYAPPRAGRVHHIVFVGAQGAVVPRDVV